MPVFAASAAIYLIATSVLVLCQHYLEGALDLDRRTRRQARNWRQWLRPRPRPANAAVSAQVENRPTDSFNWLDHASGDSLFSRYREAVRRAAGRDAAAGRSEDSERDVIVQVQGLEKRFGSLTVLDDFDLSVQRGEVLCILGPSGSGKSTLLRILDGLDVASEGTLKMAGVQWVHGHQGPTDLLRRRRRVHPRDRLPAGLGLVFQRFNLFEHRTALANVMDAPTRVLGVDRDLCDEVSRTLLREVGLEGREESYPHQLSGGQQQRVAIARALALAPEVMFFDEPTSALDPELVGEVVRVMAQLAGHGMTMIVATHEIEFARRCASRVLFMEKGVVVEEGPPQQLFTNPRQARTREFLAAITNTDLTAAHTYSESAVSAEA